MVVFFDENHARTVGLKPEVLKAIFFTLLAASTVAALQTVGAFLVVAMVVTPGATAYLLTDSFSRMLWGGAFLGLLSASGGLLLSFFANIPSGPCIVLLMALFMGTAYLFSPRYGVVTRLFRGRHFHEESLGRWEGHQGHDHQVPQGKNER
jgi:manganese/iron transport system permease protein